MIMDLVATSVWCLCRVACLEQALPFSNLPLLRFFGSGCGGGGLHSALGFNVYKSLIGQRDCPRPG